MIIVFHQALSICFWRIFRSDIVKSTGSFVGNVFYGGVYLYFTNTGSRFVDIGTKTGTDGYSLKYKSQLTIREHSYTLRNW